VTLATVAQENAPLYGVPTMFIAELDHRIFQIRSVVAAHRNHGRRALPDPVMRRVNEQMNMREVTICYGMIPARSASKLHRRSADRRVSTVGRIHPHVEVKVVILRPRGARGERGELHPYYSVCSAIGMNRETADALDASGWMPPRHRHH
jgi:fatty-acyl-CoA synthase